MRQAWVRVESSVPRHPKFLEAGPAASWLWLCGLAYAQDGLTDGFIPFQALRMLGVKNAESLKRKLVTVKLWDEVPGGWQIHDYLVHNRSADDVRRIQQERRDGGKSGGRKPLSETLKVSLPRNPSTETTTETEPQTAYVRHAPLVARRRLDAAWEGPKGLYVPQRKHSDFIQLRNHPGAEAELLAWYAEVADAWEGSPGADMMKFWTDRYGEKWPAPVKPKVDDRRPAWMRQ